MILTKRIKANFRREIDKILSHPLMSSVEPCRFTVYGDLIFTYEMQSITNDFFQISFIPINPLSCVLESETIEQLLSIPCAFLEVALVDEKLENMEILLRYQPKQAFDYNLN